MRFPIVVRYSECDMQHVVHNSVYLRWCDDLADEYFRALTSGLAAGEWDVMVKAASITWTGPARPRDVVHIDVDVARFGTTSFDVRYRGHRDDDPLFEATMTYVCVRPGSLETVPVPDELRAAVADA